MIYYLGLRGGGRSGEDFVAKAHSEVESLLILLTDWWRYTKIVYMSGGELTEMNDTLQNHPSAQRARTGYRQKQNNPDDEKDPSEISDNAEHTPAGGKPLSLESEDAGTGQTFDPEILGGDVEDDESDIDSKEPAKETINDYDQIAYFTSYMNDGIRKNERERDIFELMSAKRLSTFAPHNRRTSRPR